MGIKTALPGKKDPWYVLFLKSVLGAALGALGGLLKHYFTAREVITRRFHSVIPVVYEIHGAAFGGKVDFARRREVRTPTLAVEKWARGVKNGRCVAVAFAAVVKEVVTALREIFHSNWPDFVTTKPRTPAWYVLIIPISGQLWGLLFLFRPPLWEVRHETNGTAEMEDVQFLTELAKNERVEVIARRQDGERKRYKVAFDMDNKAHKQIFLNERGLWPTKEAMEAGNGDKKLMPLIKWTRDVQAERPVADGVKISVENREGVGDA